MSKKFLVQIIIITFIYLLTLFIVQKLKKFLQRILSYKDAPFLGPKKSICPKRKKIFWKNSSSRSSVMRIRNFWAQNGPFAQMRIFFRKRVNEPCFFHSCQSTCQKSKSDINLLVKYWRLKNTEISLAKSHFGL